MIRFENVTKSYARSTKPALDGIDLEMPDGQFAYLVGVSGSGKSTVIRLLLREDVATSGRIVVAGRDLTRITRREVPRLRRDLGVVFQDFRLLADKTVSENVAYVLHVLGMKRQLVRERVPATLETVGLSHLAKRLPHELSGGEQQRVAIARALVKNPRLLLADEPTGNLDPGTSLEIVDLLAQINETGTTVLMATHDDSIVNQLRHRVIELDGGRLVRDEMDGAYEAPRPAVDESGEPEEEDGAPGSPSAATATPTPKASSKRTSQRSGVPARGVATVLAARSTGRNETPEPQDWPPAPRTTADSSEQTLTPRPVVAQVRR